MKILVTRQIPGNHIQKLLDGHHDVHVSEFSRPLTKEELLTKIKGVDAVLSLLTDKITPEIMDAAGPQLKIISNYAVGFDNIDIDAAHARKILVTNTPCDEVNIAVAEHSFALLMNLARRITEADEVVKDGAYKGWEPDIFLGQNVTGKTLGIVGLGRIGSMVAKFAQGFNMQILYTKKTPDPEVKIAKFMSLEELLANSDFISLHVPLTDETRHMVNKDSLKKFKPGSFLINTARGAIVNENDLVQSLRSGHVAGAGLDVFDNEPNINPELVGMENVILTPHIASATWEAREKMGELAVTAILDVASGKTPQNIAQ